RVFRQSRIREGCNVQSNLRDLSEVSAAVSRTALDEEAILVTGIVGPRQVDLVCRHCRSDQVCWCIWRRSGSWCRRWCWCRSRRWITATTCRESERTDARAPVELTGGRVILRRKPESAIIYRIDRQRCVVAPTTSCTTLTSRAREKRRLALAQHIHRIGGEPARVAQLREDCRTRSAVADGKVAVAVHRCTSQPAPG